MNPLFFFIDDQNDQYISIYGDEWQHIPSQEMKVCLYSYEPYVVDLVILHR